MAGWIIILGFPERLATAAARLERAFAVGSMPEFVAHFVELSPTAQLLQWSWGTRSDVDLSVAKNMSAAAILDGYLTSWRTNGHGKADNAGSACEDLLGSGQSAVSSFNGSFACVRLDLVNMQASVWADRIASRPVWIADQDGTWYVGNSTAAMATVMERPPKLNPAGLWSLFLSSRHVGSQGLYAGFRNLHGGERAELNYSDSGGSLKVHKGWSLEFSPDHTRSAGSWGEEIAGQLQTSAERLLNVSPSPHLFLSGGLDSRIAMGALGESVKGVTLTSTPNNMNVRIARRAAHLAGASHQTIERSANWYLDRFEAAALLAGGNYNLVHAHYLAPIPVVHSEDPRATFLLGDLLENFNKHYFKSENGKQWRFMPEDIPSFYDELYSYMHPDIDRLRRLFQPDVASLLEEAWRAEFVDLCRDVRHVSDDDRDCFDALFRWYDCSLCPTYLMLQCIRPLSGERNLMFDNDMVDLLTRIPAELRGAGVLHPWTLWHLNKRLALLPDSNYWLPPMTPKLVKQLARKVRPIAGRIRRKAARARNETAPAVKTEGSWHMLGTRYRDDEPHREFIEAVLNDPSCFPPEIFRPEETSCGTCSGRCHNKEALFRDQHVTVLWFAPPACSNVGLAVRCEN